MNNVSWFVLCLLINTIWMVAALRINEGWYRHAREDNKDWSEFCRKIIEEAYGYDNDGRKADVKGYSQDSDSIGEDREMVLYGDGKEILRISRE